MDPDSCYFGVQAWLVDDTMSFFYNRVRVSTKIIISDWALGSRAQQFDSCNTNDGNQKIASTVTRFVLIWWIILIDWLVTVLPSLTELVVMYQSPDGVLCSGDLLWLSRLNVILLIHHLSPI